jgi:hypothetical protein
MMYVYVGVDVIGVPVARSRTESRRIIILFDHGGYWYWGDVPVGKMRNNYKRIMRNHDLRRYSHFEQRG